MSLTHPSFVLNYGTTPNHIRNSLTNCAVKRPEVNFCLADKAARKEGFSHRWGAKQCRGTKINISVHIYSVGELIVSKYVAESINNWLQDVLAMKALVSCVQNLPSVVDWSCYTFANNQFAYIEECSSELLWQYSHLLYPSCLLVTDFIICDSYRKLGLPTAQAHLVPVGKWSSIKHSMHKLAHTFQ